MSFEEDELERRLPNTHDWQTMSPGEKQARLLDKALDCKREILTLSMPDPNDDSIEAHRIRMLILAAADLTIEQTIRLQTNQLKPAAASPCSSRGTLENAQAMAAHESPRTTKLYDRTGDEITLDEVERITI